MKIHSRHTNTMLKSHSSHTNTMLKSHKDTTLPLHKGRLSPTVFMKKLLALMKQSFELSILCGVPICMIVDGRPYTYKIYVGPKSLHGFKRVVSMWRDKKQGVLKSLRRKTSVNIPDNSTLDEVRNLLIMVDEKLDALSEKIVFARKCMREKSSVGSERLLTDGGMKGLIGVDEEREVAVRKLVDLIKWFMKDCKSLGNMEICKKIGIHLKEKLHATGDLFYEKIEKLTICQISELLVDIVTKIDHWVNPLLTLGTLGSTSAIVRYGIH